jgi:hypothetical protein
MNLSVICTVCIVIVLYIHVYFQLKTSDDLEVYEIQMPNKQKLEEVCNFKQPVVFDYYEENIMGCTLASLQEYNAFDITLCDSAYTEIPLPLEKAMELFKTSKYASYHNSPFLNETMAKRYFSATDMALRPPLVSSIHYDVMFGAEKYMTRLQYSKYYRNYLLVTHGSITLKLAPPRNSVFLNEIKQYETEEYFSLFNPWTDVNKKIKFLEITLTQGKLLFIPAYWWYSIRLEKDACVCMFTYSTIMNILARLPDTAMGFLQRQNTKTRILPTANVST